MAKVNKKSIDKIFEKIYVNFNELEYRKKENILKSLENKAREYDGEQLSEYQAIEISFEKIKYHFSRIYIEGKAKSTLNNIKKNIDFLEEPISYLSKFNLDEREINVIKNLITYLEISMNLDVTFYTNLIDIYQICLDKNNLNFNDIKYMSQRGRNR